MLFNKALESVIRKILVTANGVNIGADKHLIVAVYAVKLVILAEDKVDLKDTTKNLLENGKETDLKINEDKTKCMVLTKNIYRVGHLDIDNYKFERVNNFKYLGVNINKDAAMKK